MARMIICHTHSAFIMRSETARHATTDTFPTKRTRWLVIDSARVLRNMPWKHPKCVVALPRQFLAFTRLYTRNMRAHMLCVCLCEWKSVVSGTGDDVMTERMCTNVGACCLRVSWLVSVLLPDLHIWIWIHYCDTSAHTNTRTDLRILCTYVRLPKSQRVFRCCAFHFWTSLKCTLARLPNIMPAYTFNKHAAKWLAPMPFSSSSLLCELFQLFSVHSSETFAYYFPCFHAVPPTRTAIVITSHTKWLI